MTERALVNEELDDSGEQALVERVLEEPVAFAGLYRRYLNPVYYYLLSKIGDPHEAEDLTAQVFLQALEGLANFRPGSNFPAWLFTIARRRAIDHFRKRQELGISSDLDLPSSSGDLLTEVIEDEALDELAKQVAGLSADEQELLRLRFAAGLRFADIAALLKRKESSVKMALYRLLARLAKQLGEDYE